MLHNSPPDSLCSLCTPLCLVRPFGFSVSFIYLSLFIFFFSISFCILARCKRELAENDPADSRWCIYPKQWWILPVKINQLLQVGSASSSCCLLSSSSCHLLSAVARFCRASRPRLSSWGLNPFHTSASRGAPPPPPFLHTGPDQPSIASSSLSNLPFPYSLLGFLLSLSLSLLPPFLLATTPFFIPSSITLSNGHQGRESAQSCRGQTLITHTVTWSWRQSHPSVLRAAVFPLVALLYSSWPKQLQEARLQNEANQITAWIGWAFIPLPPSFRWGMAISILKLFITETGQPKLKPPHSFCYSADVSDTIQTTVRQFHISQVVQHEIKKSIK